MYYFINRIWNFSIGKNSDTTYYYNYNVQNKKNIIITCALHKKWYAR